MSSFTDNEAGFDTSKPVEWIRVVYGADVEFLYTPSDQTIVHLGKTYVPAEISRSELGSTSDRNKSVLQVSIPVSLPLAQQFLAVPPSASVSLTLFRAQRADLADATVEWVGIIRDREILDQQMVLQCTNLLAATGRKGNALRYQKSCPYAIYGAEGCGVNPEEFKVSANAIVDSSVTLYAPATIGYPDDWFIGGFVSYQDVVSGVVGKRFIVNYASDTGLVTVFPPLRGVDSGQLVNFYAGCDHTSRTCNDKFDNLLNHGGDPVLPLVNPFDPREQIF